MKWNVGKNIEKKIYRRRNKTNRGLFWGSINGFINQFKQYFEQKNT